MQLRITALTVMIAVSSFTYGQTDTTKNIVKSVAPNINTQFPYIERSGDLINSAGVLYNVSSAIAIVGSTTGSILIANGETDAGLIVTSAAGIAAYVIKTVGNVKLAQGGKQLRRIKQISNSNAAQALGNKQSDNSNHRKINLGKLSLELRPRLGYRTYSYFPTNAPIRTVKNNQYYLGSPDIRYSRSNFFLRLGVPFTRITKNIDITDPNRTDYGDSYIGLSPSIGLGLIIKDKNEISVGVNTLRYNDMSLINFDYSYYLKKHFALSLTLYCDYYQWSSYPDLMPSIGMTYRIGK